MLLWRTAAFRPAIYFPDSSVGNWPKSRLKQKSLPAKALSPLNVGRICSSGFPQMFDDSFGKKLWIFPKYLMEQGRPAVSYNLRNSRKRVEERGSLLNIFRCFTRFSKSGAVVVDIKCYTAILLWPKLSLQAGLEPVPCFSRRDASPLRHPPALFDTTRHR